MAHCLLSAVPFLTENFSFEKEVVAVAEQLPLPADDAAAQSTTIPGELCNQQTATRIAVPFQVLLWSPSRTLPGSRRLPHRPSSYRHRLAIAACCIADWDRFSCVPCIRSRSSHDRRPRSRQPSSNPDRPCTRMPKRDPTKRKIGHPNQPR